MELGLVGLGRMGGGMRARWREFDHTVWGWSPSGKEVDVATIEEMVEKLAPPRTIWLMVPAGQPTEDNVVAFTKLLSSGDIIVDGGNSRYTDSIRRAQFVGESNIGYIDAGVSGGVWGLKEGFSIMVGGDDTHVSRLTPLFEALAPKGGYAHVGPSGAGHFTKMIHNGIEYGMMQSLGEGYELLKASELGIDVPAALECWQHGSVVRSWLLDLLVLALQEDPELAAIQGYVQDSGEGRWTVEEAVRLGVPATALSHALFARFASREDDSAAMKVVAALRNQFGGHAVKNK